MHVACNYHYLGWVLTWNIWSKGFGRKSIFTSEVYTVEYFLYIIQIMLQYTPFFNKVCYTLRLQGCFLKIYKSKYYASAGGYVVQAVLLFSLCIDHGGYMSARLVSRLRKSQFPLPGVSKKNVPGKLIRNYTPHNKVVRGYTGFTMSVRL